MKTYKVFVSFGIGSGFSYRMEAKCIADAASFVRHWDNVRVVRVL